MFGMSGFIGSCFAAGWKNQAIDKYSSSFTAVLGTQGEQFQFYAFLISMAFGLIFGIFAGLVTFCTNHISNNQYFDDSYYWRNSDSIRTRHPTDPIDRPKPVPAPVPVPVPDYKNDPKDNTRYPDNDEASVVLEFSEAEEEAANNRHAYL